MSVGVAVIGPKRKSIVCVSDLKVTFGDFAADNIARKDMPVAQTGVIIAGDDIEHATPILDRAKEIMRGVTSPVKVSDVANAIDEAYGERLQQEIYRRVLRKQGFTVDSFRDQGKQKCTPTAYLAMLNKIERVKISLKFLISGFDHDDKAEPHIYVVDGESAPASYDEIGMWAIGKGAHSALSFLAFLAERHFSPSYAGELETAVYFALGAKFMAESCGEVGRGTTFAWINDSDHSQTYLTHIAVLKIKEIWELEGAPKLPENIVKQIRKCIDDYPYPSLANKKSTSQKSAGQQ